jgi:hypothetical protein
MFKVIDSLTEKPIKMLFKDALYFPDPGMIVSLHDGIAKICNGEKPFGVIGDYPDEFSLIPIWYEAMVFETTMIEPDKFEIKDKLYCSQFGKFTNKKISEDSLLLGFVFEVKENSLIIELI